MMIYVAARNTARKRKLMEVTITSHKQGPVNSQNDSKKNRSFLKVVVTSLSIVGHMRAGCDLVDWITEDS